jgi:hypothetical protein
MRTIETSKPEKPLYDFAFSAGWDSAYTAAVERLAFETAAKCTHSYDTITYFDAVSASVFHPDAKTAIVREFLKSATDLVNKEFDLRLQVEMTRYDGEYGAGGTAYGRIETDLSEAEIVSRVAAALAAKCGAVPEFEVDFENGYLLDWCLECTEIADAGDLFHDPTGDCAAAVAERLQQSGVVLASLRSALNLNALDKRLSDPDRVAFDRKHRARAIHF